MERVKPFKLDYEFMANGTIPVKKYISTREASCLNIYFANIDSQVINGYLCFGIDHPDATSIESVLAHFDSSMGFVPKPLRGETLKPAWQFHGSENSLSDRDQSCYVCTALGEKSFQGIFTCAMLMLENLDHLFGGHDGNNNKREGAAHVSATIPQDEGYGDIESDPEVEPKIISDEVYCLSEAGEGAMAWEGTLQLLFPDVKAFRNRLLSSADGTTMSQEIVNCFYNFYRPDNLTVVITGTVEDESKILSTVASYENEYYNLHGDTPFIHPWTTVIPRPVYAKDQATSVAHFIPRNPNREPLATLCLGWRGSSAMDLETVMALKVITAHLAVGPFWTRFVASGLVQRISWCQLEYVDACLLITLHGLLTEEVCNRVCKETDEILDDLGNCQEKLLKLDEIQVMADRVGWHHVREFEADPFLVLASGIFKGERYGVGEHDHLEKRLNPLATFLELKKRPLDFWQGLIRTYFIGGGTFATKVLPSSYDKPTAPSAPPPEASSVEAAEAQQFTSSSRRASSRPRRRVSAVGEETENVQTADSKSSPRPQMKQAKPGHLEQLLNENVFPFGNRAEELVEFNERLEDCANFITDVAGDENRSFSIESYQSGDAKQHPSFPVDNMPFFTFLEDLDTSFVYATVVMDTTHLNSKMRKYIAPLTAALGALICPRPPSLDTDHEIVNPTEFNPPKKIIDSQVSLGVNGEMMQYMFLMMIVLPEDYNWVVGMFEQVLNSFDFSTNFLKFIAVEAIKGLAANYRMQSAEVPNYDCFDGSEINLHSLVEMIYEKDSNARLFVGRRRLDAMNEFLIDLDRDPDGTRQQLLEAWKTIVEEKRFVLQLAMKVDKVSDGGKVDLVMPWKKSFEGIGKPWQISNGVLHPESDLMKKPKGNGIAVVVNHPRPPCFTTAIPIDPTTDDFPKLCIASQLFSMAQRWIFACFGEDDIDMPVLRMPCSYSHLLTLNLESHDVLGFLELMKRVVKDDWEWLDSMMITTKQLVIHDPALLDNGPQGAVMTALMAHLSGIPTADRRNLLMVSLKVTKEEVQEVIRKYLVKLFDPKECWYALMSDSSNQDLLLERLQDSGFIFEKRNLYDLCSEL